MTKIKYNLFALIPVLAILVQLGACSKPKPVNKAKVATSFVLAINQNDTKIVAKLSGTPISIRNQEWESAQDGQGFAKPGSENNTS